MIASILIPISQRARTDLEFSFLFFNNVQKTKRCEGIYEVYAVINLVIVLWHLVNSKKSCFVRFVCIEISPKA